MKNLAVDIGNTSVKLGLFAADQLVATTRLDDISHPDFKIWVTNHLPENIILSTVGVTVASDVLAFLRKQTKHCLLLDHTTPLPITNAYGTPETLGKDRLAAVCGAQALFPGTHCLVIDAGTCITVDILQANGVYRGGNIAPGLRMRLRAMHEFTARLPLADREWPGQWIGDSTQQALQNGALWGALLEMQGYAARCRDQFGHLNVLLTGGDSLFLAKKWKSQIFVNQNLVLYGLNKILSHNVERSE